MSPVLWKLAAGVLCCLHHRGRHGICSAHSPRAPSAYRYALILNSELPAVGRRLERNVVAQNTLAGSIGIPAKVEIGLSVLGAFLKVDLMVHEFFQAVWQLRETRYLQTAFLQFFF